MRILKFGGKSLDSLEKTQKICKYIKKIYKKEKELIIVVSAIGKTTDKLIEKASHYSNGNPTKRDMSALLSIGETESSCLFSMMLNSMNIPAKSFQAKDLSFLTTDSYDNAQVIDIDKSVLVSCLKNKTVAVVAGFQGINKNGETTTLGRGGSDTTAVALGVVFNTSVEIYSDFDGVFCGDPRKLNYKKLKTISLESMCLMSENGAKVISSRASKLALNNNLKIISKSSISPNKKGSIISPVESNNISITALENLCMVSIIFDNEQQLKFILKNVDNVINTCKIYNLTVKTNLIQILINQNDYSKINYVLSKKLNLLK